MATHDANSASHYQSPWLRQLPHYRTWFPAVKRSCNPFVDSPTLRGRRIAFLLIILMRIIEALFFVFVLWYRRPGFLFSTIWMLVVFLAFLFVAWNLHLIVEAEGGRRVISKLTFPSGVFTAFLWLMVVVHVILIGLEITGLSWFIDGTRKTWLGWMLVVTVVAWVAGREEEEGTLTLA
ncbi:hypothetical protein SVAN01_09131 [Stagonosporopsis vannaccii]|nr:hypothetical protein SVAN01_09131 [Stagonosporopsis vannaccii]